uniref:Cyclin C-terminal domain-containing protein n=1 Tax=Oncorhynchus kisutch TaxID=8019 RepID=A0A8C7HXA7_ONCKI
WVEGLNVPQAFSHALDYVKDFYAYLRKFLNWTHLNSLVLIDWLVHVQRQLTALLAPSTPVPKKSLQLVVVTARLIAYKYEEIAHPMVEDFAHTTDFTYSCAEIRLMEMTILKALNYELGRPPPVHFLWRTAKLLPVGYGLAKYLLVLTLLDYASTPALQHYMGYTEDSLLPVMQCIAKMLECLNDGNMKQLSIKQKYETVKLLRVSCLPELASTRAYAYINKLANCHC